MRDNKRIPIIYKFFRNNPKIFFEFIGSNITEEEIRELHSTPLLGEFFNYWQDNFDMRLGQALINFGTVEDDFRLWNREEVDWLIEKGYFQPEDIFFWGRNFDKDNNKLEKTEYVLLKDLTTDHIKNIISYFGEKVNRIIPKYLEYFNRRIVEDKIE